MKISALTIFLGILLSTSCVQQQKPNEGKPVVTVSIIPQKYFLEQLAGRLIEVNVLIPPGANPSTYEPSVSQLSQLNRSNIYLKLGYLGFELSWMEKILSVNPTMEVVSMSEGIRLISGTVGENEQKNHHGHGHLGLENLEDGHNHSGIDPHIWMSARNAIIMASNTARALYQLLPEDSAQIAGNLSIMQNRLDSLDHEIGNILSGTEGKSFMIYHPALAYFARDYKLEQLSLEWEGKTPSPSHMKKLTDLGRELNISTIFVQVEFDKNNAAVLSKEIGAEIVSINPLDYNWDKQMIRIATKLKEAQ